MVLFLYPFGGDFMDALTDKQMVRVNWKPIHASFTHPIKIIVEIRDDGFGTVPK